MNTKKEKNKSKSNEIDTPKVENQKNVKIKPKKKIKRNIDTGIAYVYSTFNNTIISISDENGNVVSWSSAGKKGFKGLKTVGKSVGKTVGKSVGKGAGKSVLLNCLSLATGRRSDVSFLRKGASEGSVSVEFNIKNNFVLKEDLSQLGISYDNNQIFLRRVFE